MARAKRHRTKPEQGLKSLTGLAFHRSRDPIYNFLFGGIT